jgi:hypothetical protein
MNPVGLEVKLDRRIDRETPCCRNICLIHAGKGPHIGELRCADCARHRGWLPQEAACWIESVIAICGMPTTPIEVRTDHEPSDDGTKVAVPESEWQRRIYEIRRRIEVAKFELKDFFLSSRQRDWYREQQRQKIAHLMALYHLSAHDLMPPITAEQANPIFIARLANGHETCTEVFCSPDKLDITQGVMLARRAFDRLMGAPPEYEIVSARFEWQGRVLATYNEADLHKISELPSGAGAVGGM